LKQILQLPVDLAKKIEKLAAEESLKYVEATREVFPEIKAEFFEFEGGGSSYCGKSPRTVTYGFGVNPTDHGKLLNEIEDFFGKHKCPARICLPTNAQPDCVHLLRKKLYSPVDFQNVFTYDQNQPLSFTENPKIVIKEVQNSEDLELAVILLSAGFANKNESSNNPIVMTQAKKRGNRFFVVYVDDIPAAGSCLYMDGGTAKLLATGTLPKFRGLGIQKACIVQRVNIALEAGCELILSESNVETSVGNLLKAGFSIKYVRCLYMEKSWL
jgi:hypothetical protein